MTPPEHQSVGTMRPMQAALLMMIGVALLANWCLALLYLFAWAHFDGRDRGTETVILAIGAAVVVGPTLICLWPSKVNLLQRLLVCVLTFGLGYLLMELLG